MELLPKIKRHCMELLKKSPCIKLPFHNYEHTEEVVGFVQIIVEELSLDVTEIEDTLIAAWFHDTGFSQSYEQHENHSKTLAKQWLEAEGVSDVRINSVLACIDATRMGAEPTTLQAKILCDADLFHLTSCDYFYHNLLLRKEWEQVRGTTFTDREWFTLNLAFLTQHRFYTNGIPVSNLHRFSQNKTRLQKLITITE